MRGFSGLGSNAEQRLPCSSFSLLWQHPGIPCGNTGFRTSSCVRCVGACAAAKSSRKPLMRYGLTRIILQLPEPASLWSEILVQGALGRKNEGRRPARAQGFFLVVGVLARGIKHILFASESPGQMRIWVAPSMQAEAPVHVAFQTRQAASTQGCGPVRGCPSHFFRENQSQEKNSARHGIFNIPTAHTSRHIKKRICLPSTSKLDRVIIASRCPFRYCLLRFQNSNQCCRLRQM